MTLNTLLTLAGAIGITGFIVLLGALALRRGDWRYCKRCGYYWNVRTRKQFNYMPESADGVVKHEPCESCQESH